MKHTEIEIDRQLETRVENEVQQTLRKALALLGPHGERWCKWVQEEGKNHCAVGAVSIAMTGEPYKVTVESSAPMNMLAAAVAEKSKIFGKTPGQTVAAYNNTKRFPAVRAMFERAIELAA